MSRSECQWHLSDMRRMWRGGGQGVPVVAAAQGGVGNTKVKVFESSARQERERLMSVDCDPVTVRQLNNLIFESIKIQ